MGSDFERRGEIRQLQVKQTCDNYGIMGLMESYSSIFPCRFLPWLNGYCELWLCFWLGFNVWHGLYILLVAYYFCKEVRI